VAARLNGGSEDNIDPGFKVWSEHTKQIHSLVTSTQQMQDLLVKGDAWLTPWFKGNQAVWAKDGAPLGFAIPKEGGVAFPLYVTIAAGTTPDQKQAAEEIINLILSPKYQARYVETTYTAPSSSKVQLPPAVAQDPAYSTQTLQNAMQLDWAKMAEHNQEWKDRWDREVKAKL
jgi:putative spermidine/putrescine transport system substrate-binding protein